MKKAIAVVAIVLTTGFLVSNTLANCGGCGAAAAPKKTSDVTKCNGPCGMGQALNDLGLSAEQLKKIGALRSEFRKSVASVLTPEQLAKFTAACPKMGAAAKKTGCGGKCGSKCGHK